MPKRDEFASVSLDVNAGTEPVPAQPRSETPFRILLLGDFSGRRDRDSISSRSAEPISIDRDNFDDVLAGMGVELHLGGREAAAGIRLTIRSLDDFHPDRIFDRSEAFGTLREMRRKLSSPSNSPEAVSAVKKWAGLPAPPPPAPVRPDPAVPFTGSLLDAVVDAMEPRPSQVVSSRDELKSFVEQVVAPHVLPQEDPQLPELIARVDAVASELMRAILHDPHFQALEAAWRAVHFLVRGLETNELLKVYLLDISRTELAEQSAKYRALAHQLTPTPGAEPWAVVAGNFAFGQTEGDIKTLDRLADLMRAAGAPFLAEADPAVDSSPGWNSLRRSPAASWLGLALPRFLLRLPYGPKTEPIEGFRFEEMPGTPVHQEYLWGNPAFACAYLLGHAFSINGWDIRPGAYQEVEGLPLHVYEDGGEQKLQSCAEIEMSASDAEWVLDQGCMPLVWAKGQSAVCLLRFQSIADPPAPLSGRWNQPERRSHFIRPCED